MANKETYEQKKKKWQDAADKHSKFWEEQQKALHERNKRAVEKAKRDMERGYTKPR